MKRAFFAMSVILCLVLLCPAGAVALQPEDIVVVVEPSLEFVQTGFFREGLADVQKDGKWGFIDTGGKIVIPLEYVYVDHFCEGLASVAKNGKMGFIDTAGEVVIPLDYDGAWRFREGLAAVKKDGKWEFIDTTGKIVITLDYDEARWFNEGLAAVKKDSKWGFIDTNGKIVIPLNYDEAQGFNEGLAAVKKDGKWGCIDANGKIVIPLDYDSALLFNEGLAAVEKDGKWGYIDAHGKTAVPLEYDFADRFCEGLATVRSGSFEEGKYGYIDVTGKIAIPLEYDGALSFSEGLAAVKKDGKWGFIDTGGKIMVPLEYDEFMSFFNEGYVLVLKDGRWGILHNTAYGKPATVTPPTVTQNPFSDVQPNTWYFDGVMYAYGHGLMNGTSADKFSPEDSLTRAMIVTILCRQAKEPDVSALINPFSDVPAGTWYTEAVKWAAENGIVSGYGNGKFGPNDAVTKEQLAAILYRLQQRGEIIPPDILMDREYPDFNSISDYAKGAVTKLTMQGIFRDIPGVGFNPKANATRAEVAAMLYRYLSVVK